MTTTKFARTITFTRRLAIGVVALGLAASGCMADIEDGEFSEDDWEEDENIGQVEQAAKTCVTLNGTKMCQADGLYGQITAEGGSGDNKINLTLHKDFSAGEVWVTGIITKPGVWCSLNNPCGWTSRKSPLHAFDTRANGYWNTDYFNISVRMHKGADEFFGQSRDDNNGATHAIFQSRVYGQGGGDLIQNATYVEGGDGADTIYGSDWPDTLKGNDGGDTIYGGDGNDTLKGGNGGDHLYGESGQDHLDGGSSKHDFCSGGPSADLCYSCPFMSSCTPG